jgi:hypothetical protein
MLGYDTAMPFRRDEHMKMRSRPLILAWEVAFEPVFTVFIGGKRCLVVGVVLALFVGPPKKRGRIARNVICHRTRKDLPFL